MRICLSRSLLEPHALTGALGNETATHALANGSYVLYSSRRIEGLFSSSNNALTKQGPGLQSRSSAEAGEGSTHADLQG